MKLTSQCLCGKHKRTRELTPEEWLEVEKIIESQTEAQL